MPVQRKKKDVAGQANEDRRSGNRFTTVFQVARVETDAGSEHLCLIRNIGPGGVMLETPVPVETGTRLHIEPKVCAPLKGTVCWVKDKHAGIAFDDPIDVESYLRTARPLPSGQVPRRPRVSAGFQGQLRIGRDWYPVQILDLSQGGAKVEAEIIIEQGVAVELCVERSVSLHAHVRWMRNGQAGLIFVRALSIADLAKWTGPAASGAAAA
nr:PilZ domain-containing protein [Sphingomonas tagetis]